MLQLAVACAHLLHNRTETLGRNVGNHALNRLIGLAVDLLEQCARCTDLKLIALAAEGLNQDGQMHLTASCDTEGVGRLGLMHAQGDILEQFAVQTLAELTGGDIFALASGKRRVVDREVHLNGRLGDLDKRQRLDLRRRAQRVADGDVLNTGDTDDIACGNLLNRRMTQAVNRIHGDRFCLVRLIVAVVVADHQILTDMHPSALDTADGDASDIVAVINRGNQHLQFAVRIDMRRRNVGQNSFKQRGQILALLIRRGGCRAVAAGAVQNRAVQLFIRRIQRQQQLENLVADIAQTGIRTVNLVDHDDDLVTELQRLLQNKAGLRHRTFKCIDQQNNAVYHLQDTLDLTGEVRMARSVDDVDLGVFIMNRGVLGQNGNAALTLQIIAVHDAVLYNLIGAECAALLEHLIDQRGLAVVDVRDNRNIS